MREYKAIFICILICNVFVCPKSFGQTDYTYEKGKSFKNTNALSMIRLRQPGIQCRIPVVYSRQAQSSM